MGECLVWPGSKYKNGYGIKYSKSRKRSIQAHRFVYEEAYGFIPSGLVVMHSCDNPPCVNLQHLRLGTHADNVADKIRKRRHTYGETHPNTTLTEEDVREIRRMRETKTGRAVARFFGISPSSVSDIVLYKRWAHIK